MARVVNYDKKIFDLEGKISKKQDELKKLKDELQQLQQAQDKDKVKDLLTAIEKKGLTVTEVIGWVENHKN